jgi:trimethylamine--corrinoid protein Co-methyltransferase
MICRVLNDEQVAQINQASLSILAKTGIIVPHPVLLSRFADHGAQVDHAGQRVRIPAELVEKCLASAGKRFTLYGRDVAKTAEFGQGKRNFNSIAGEALWLDNVGEERRYASLADVASATRLADALSQINIPGAMSDPHELPTAWRCVAVAAEMIRNTTKPITFWFYDRASAKYLVELMIALRGSEEKAVQYPICYPFLEPISPLNFPFDGIDLLFETARLNLPVPIGPMAQMGMSAPATLAGTMALENAEILAGVCITQLIREGMPVCYGGICHAFDMRTTQMIFSGPEQAIFGIGMTQMGKSYGLPVYINVGLSDAKRPDAQAGLESGVTLSMGMAAGADIFGHMGISGVDQAASLDMLVLQNEVISYAQSVNRQMTVDADTLALDLIDQVGPKGTFVDQEHTVMHFREELWFPELLDRSYYGAWQDDGFASMETRCRLRKEEILAAHQPEALDAAVDREFSRIVESARQSPRG